MHYIRNNKNIYHQKSYLFLIYLICHMRIRSCHSFSAFAIDLLSFIGRFEIDLTSIFLDGYLQD